MPDSPAPVRRRIRSWPRAVVRGLFALVALAALVVGVPVLLLAVGTLPATVPTLDEAREVLLSPDDDGSGLLATMTVAAWIAWLWLVVPILIEVVAVMARRTTPQLPGMATGQHLAGFLLGSIVLAMPAAAASAATPAVAATAPHTPSTDQATSGQQSASAPSAAAEKTAPAGKVQEFTVEAQDTTWWELAEQLLGDGARYTELQRLNPEAPTTATVVPQGTTLRVPGHAEVLSEAPDSGLQTQLASNALAATSEREGEVVTVETGDSLSQIAQKELGNGDAWPQLFEASQGTAQPDGMPRITDPDVIYPGQQVTVPGAAPDRPDRPPEDTDHGSDDEDSTPPGEDGTERDPGSGAEGGPSTAPSQSATSGTETPVPSESNGPTERPSEGQGAAAEPSSSSGASSAPPSGESAGSATPTTSASETPESPPSGQALQLRMVLGAGALLAAAVTGALATRRMLQRRRRKPGETIAIASETSSAEAQLASAAEPTGSARLDAALRTLAHQVEDSASLPGLRAARIGARSLEVLPEDLTLEPPVLFTAGRGGWWVLLGDAELLDEEAAREVPPPYPGLVTVGSTERGDLLLVNLAQLPALLLDGDPTRIKEVCTSLAVEMGMSPWGSVVEVVAVGFGEDLPRLLPTSRIMHMREAVHALRDLSERLLEAHQMPETSHHPYLLLCAALDEDTAWQFADVIDKARIPVTLVAPASVAATHFPDAETLNAELDEPQQLGYTGIEITVQRLEYAAYQQIATALAVSGQPATPAEGPWEEVPDEPDPGMPSRSATAEPDGHHTGTDTNIAGETSGAPVTSVAPVTVDDSNTDSEVFPALLAASTDPAGLRLLPTAPHHGQDHPDESPTEGPAEDDDSEEPNVPLPEQGNGGGTEESEAHDLRAPEIRVLGPVEVDGVAASGHGPRIAQLAALLYFRPGRSADALCTDMDPLAPWGASTLNARLRGLRSALGNDPAGDAYVPRRRTGDDPYRLSPAVRCDWTRFLQLSERALLQGPAGLTDLEEALGLVRGRPFGSRPLPWAAPFQQEMITRIIDVAHTVATHRTPKGPYHDLVAARQAIATGLDVDNSAELLYRDWMRVEHAAGNRSGLHTAITQVQQVNRTLDCSLETATEQLINELLGTTRDDQARGAVSVPHVTSSGPNGRKAPVRRTGVSAESSDAQS
ncbi:LysM peptidoglycan-binding domain-containing protein [Streptomyces sp. IB201691-2A2]|uniref:LysM peptidoglycan-binding domain-containing protein n=1 Tax=Streptomyces sp. IB201691-2A2 TaxID=2561920 RepID=UPI00117CD5D5|nr:LysM peptidoglycan-binding domain-containing protein [Streptomyces sp. IB201691-2A2]TRO57043.1 LysM peptidoglycan-binding domain-containing protein [Streptomyces sp. IB201691-2A2]